LTPQASEHQAMDTVLQVRALINGAVPQGAVNLQQAFGARQTFGLSQQ
jgi:D-3-phosphoglycerate dehydrogenase